jgi:hypothetical protein
VDGSSILLYLDIGINFHVRDRHSHGYTDAEELVEKLATDGVSSIQIGGDDIAAKISDVWDRTISPKLSVVVSKDRRPIYRARALPSATSGSLFLTIHGAGLSDP